MRLGTTSTTSLSTSSAWLLPQTMPSDERALLPEDGEVVWSEEKRSGKTMSRPKLQRLLADVARGRVRKLYTFKLDRITRSGVVDTCQTVRHLKDHGCTLVTLTDGLPPIVPGAEESLTARIAMTVLALARP